jgi:hypothetical protein
MFLYHWGRIISQFKDDVLPTEELQIIDTIKLDILMNRILRTQYETNKTISELELKMVQTADLNLLNNYQIIICECGGRWSKYIFETISIYF